MNAFVDAERRLEFAFDAAWKHSKRCRRCCMPIIKDAEGNPGLHSEACMDGVRLLDAYERAETAYMTALQARKA